MMGLGIRILSSVQHSEYYAGCEAGGNELEDQATDASISAKGSTRSDKDFIVLAAIAGVLVLALLVAMFVRSRKTSHNKLETTELTHPLTAYAETDDQ